MNDCFGIIYKATNITNGKVYIGQTVKTLEHRKKIHQWTNTKYPFHRALRRYGRESFVWEILERCDSKDELNEMEFHYIKQSNSKRPNGYNITDGGDGVVGTAITDETRSKMSMAAFKRPRRVFTDEHKKRISMSRIGNKNPNYGKPMPEHVKDLLANINKKRRGDKSTLSKKFVVTEPNGTEFIVIGLNDFCNRYENQKLNRGNLSNCAAGRHKQCKGYKCRYYNPDLDFNLPLWESN
jgi:group I intron endonuclease